MCECFASNYIILFLFGVLYLECLVGWQTPGATAAAAAATAICDRMHSTGSAEVAVSRCGNAVGRRAPHSQPATLADTLVRSAAPGELWRHMYILCVY